MGIENTGKRMYVDVQYAMKDICDGLISADMIVRHYEKLHPDYNAIKLIKFKIIHETDSIKAKLLVQKKYAPTEPTPAECEYDRLKAMYGELMVAYKKLKAELESDYKLCRCGKCAETLTKEIEESKKDNGAVK